MEAIILAGGQGTRMQKIEHKIPKVMLEINDRPFLYWIIKQLQANKVNKIILCLGIKYKQNVFIREKDRTTGKKTNKHHNILSTDTRKTQWNNNNNNHNPSNQSSKR